MTEYRKPVVCVIDDDQSVRESISMLLATVGVSVRAYADCQAYMSDPDCKDADAMILDVRLPGVNGLEFQAQFGEFIGEIPVIFVSGHGDIPMAVRAMRQGALDFLQKPFAEQVLIDRVNQAVALSSKRRINRAARAVIRARVDLLTSREREVLDGLLAGQTSKMIGDALRISTRTVEQHRARVMEKMRAASVAELCHAMSQISGDTKP